MPIRADLRHFYGREWRLVTRPRILARAGNRCEQCRVPNHAEVTRVAGWWLEWVLSWRSEPGRICWWRDVRGQIHYTPLEPPETKARTVRIVLTIAHLNHTAGDDREENLRALCQYCHLHHDLAHHRETRQLRKDAARPLLQEAASL